MTRIGMKDEKGNLLMMSDVNSQVEGGDFDGPALFHTLRAAIDANNECGGLAEGCKYVEVRLTIGAELDESDVEDADEDLDD
jgi:hypothetical protein